MLNNTDAPGLGERRSCLRSIFAVAVLATVYGCVVEPTRSSEDPLFARLMSAPDIYDGQQVTLSGFLILGPEARHFWSSRLAAEHRDGDHNCLTLTNTNAVLGSTVNLRRKVIFTGVFRKNIIPHGVIDLGTCNERGIELLSVTR
jgi:hypothetical protein